MMQYLKVITFSCILFLCCSISFAQTPIADSTSKILQHKKAPNQKQKLTQYIGTWHSADNITDKKPGKSPSIKMTVMPKMDSGSLQVEVFQKAGNSYKLIFVELISYDTVTDLIVAAGQNNEGQCFVGRGYFYKTNHWFMDDVNHKGEITLHVEFTFINNREVHLEGTTPNHKNEWKVKYIKVK